ncbi:MAG: HlyD family efflux transporter periplasmic adaptor subunit [Gammaproteobacteria bacterium]|nr:HlyD family efflux transporter periplasmic adaptor subunit [Gammaproteobacteria bacterium]
MKHSVSRGWVTLVLLLSLGTAQAEPGSLQWADRTTVSSLASGEVVKVVAAGQRLQQGEILMQLEPTTFERRVAALKAIVNNAREQRAEAKAELDRNQEMFDQTMLALHDLQLSKLAYIEADAEYQRARAELAEASFMQQQSALRAPFNAIVLSTQVGVGETLNNSQTSRELMVIARRDQMLAVAEVELQKALGLKTGEKAVVELNGREINGRIHAIGLDGNGLARVEVIIDAEPGPEALPGQKIQVDF